MSADFPIVSGLNVTASEEGQAILGGTAQLCCEYSIEAKHFQSVTWYYKGLQFSTRSRMVTGTWEGIIDNTNDEKYNLIYDYNSQATLSISDIELVDERAYTCRVIADTIGSAWSKPGHRDCTGYGLTVFHFVQNIKL